MLTALLWVCAAIGLIVLGVVLVSVILGTGVAIIWFLIKAIVSAFPVLAVILLIIWAIKLWNRDEEAD